jgi:hypothetical protein
MLRQIETSILARLAPVRELLRPDGVLVRGLPDDAFRMTQEDAGDVVVFIKGGNIREVRIEVNVLLPSRVKSSTACFPVIEQIWGLLHTFLPTAAAGVLANMNWELMTQDTRWLVNMNYTAAISPYVSEFPDADDTLPGIDEIIMNPIAPPAPSFSVAISSML